MAQSLRGMLPPSITSIRVLTAFVPNCDITSQIQNWMSSSFVFARSRSISRKELPKPTKTFDALRRTPYEVCLSAIIICGITESPLSFKIRIASRVTVSFSSLKASTRSVKLSPSGISFSSITASLRTLKSTSRSRSKRSFMMSPGARLLSFIT